jgi:hypothetical protein
MSLLWLLSVYNYIDSRVTGITESTLNLYIKIRDSFKERVYILFSSISTPYILPSVNLSASSSAMPEWYYFPDTHSFVEWLPDIPVVNGPIEGGQTHNLPVLSMEILQGEDVICDLTNFIARVKVHTYSVDTLPSIAHIIGAWSIHSKLVLDRKSAFMARIIDTEANTMDIPIENYDFMPYKDVVVEDIPEQVEPVQEVETMTT